MKVTHQIPVYFYKIFLNSVSSIEGHSSQQTEHENNQADFSILLRNFRFIRASIKARFDYERRMEHSLFLLLIFRRLKSKRALSEAKNPNKTNKEYSIPRS